LINRFSDPDTSADEDFSFEQFENETIRIMIAMIECVVMEIATND